MDEAAAVDLARIRAAAAAGSAGNHGQAVAYAARERGVPCEAGYDVVATAR